MASPTMERATQLGLEGSAAVVVGASEGIGQAIAVGLATAGSHVVVASRSRGRLEGTVGQIDERGGTCQPLTVDASDPASIAAFKGEVLDQLGAPQIVVNSMGGGLIKEAVDVEVGEWDALMDTHMRGAFLLCQAFAPGMRERGYGKIINLSSTWAFTVGRGRSVYAAAKAGLGHLTSALSYEWAPHGVRVNALAPGTTKTPRVERTLRENPEREAYVLERLPLGRIAEPVDMVGPALFLASPMSDFVTGHTLLVDGGWVTAK